MNDATISLSQLKEAVRLFCTQREWDQFHNPKDLAIGISTEANELLDIFRFKSEKQVSDILGDPKKRKNIGEELADVLYFTLRFSQMYEFDLSSELLNKLKVNEQRYPVDRARASNRKYSDGGLD